MQLLKTLKTKAKQLKSETQVLIVAYGDTRTPLSAKLLIGLTVAYLMSPIDLIPDFIPVLGILDDLLLVPLLITLSIKQIPTEVLADAREEVKVHPPTLKKNWLVAVVIVVLWLALGYALYREFLHEAL